MVVKIDTKQVCDELYKQIDETYKAMKEHPELKFVRFQYDGARVFYEYNVDYLLRPSLEWRMIMILHPNLLDILYDTNDVDIYIKSKVLQWVAKCISKTYCKIEFEQLPEFDEEQFMSDLKEVPREN